MKLNTLCTELNKEYAGFTKEMYWRLHMLNSVNSICDIISIHSSVIKIKRDKMLVIVTHNKNIQTVNFKNTVLTLIVYAEKKYLVVIPSVSEVSKSLSNAIT